MSGDASNVRVDELKYLWSEYKYRHELCWSAVYKVTVAVLALGIVPYGKDNLTAVLQNWMLVPPLVGTALALFGIFLVQNELDLFAKIKLAYRIIQKRFLESL